MRTSERAALALVVFTSLAVAQPRVTAILNGASFGRFVCAGAIASVFGTALAPVEVNATAVPLPVTLGGVSVTVDGVAAPLYFVSPRQINVQIPFEITAASVSLVVRTPQGNSSAYRVDLLPTAPGIFTLSADGTGTPVLLSPDFKLLSTVRGGQRVILYATGLGPTDPPAVSGSGGAMTEPFQRVVRPPEVYIGNQPATVEFAGLAPGFPGVYQLNISAPAEFASDQIRLIAGGWPSNVTTFPTTLPQPVAGSGVLASENREVAGFRRIQLFAVGSVEVEAGPSVSAWIEADDNLLPLITTTVRGGALQIRTTRPYEGRDSRVRIRVSTPALEGVEVFGVGSISAAGVSGKRFEVRMSGVGSVTASGSVQAVDVLTEGVGAAALFGLGSERTAVWMTGVGTVEVNATQSLFARVFGLGNVRYTGNPSEIDVQVDGLGSVRPR